MKILFIGNSYTYYNDLPALFRKLADENGYPAETFSVTCGGRRLIENLEKTDEYSAQLDDLLSKHVFDYVILQEHSVGSLLGYEDFVAGIRGLREKIGGNGKQFVLYSTWGRKPGSPTLEEHGWTQAGMTRDIENAYRRAGESLGMAVSYVGVNFYKVSCGHPAIDLFAPDLTHPSFEGSCLAAITLFDTLFGVYPAKMNALALPKETENAFLTLAKG